MSRGLGCYPLGPVRDLRELVRKSAASFGDATAFLFKDEQKQVRTRSYLDLARDVDRRAGIDVRRVLFRKVFEALGPNLRLAVVGAAPLDPEIVIGFDRLGLRILQGYGLTETSPMTAGTCDLLNIPDTLGVPIANVDVAIDQPDANGMGEIHDCAWQRQESLSRRI